MTMQIEGYLLSYRINGNGNVWMLRFDTEEQAKAHVQKVGLDTPCYQHTINAIVNIPTVTEGV